MQIESRIFLPSYLTPGCVFKYVKEF